MKNLRVDCPDISYHACERESWQDELDWRIEDFKKWKAKKRYEPIGGICNRVTSILWRAFDWDMPYLQDEVVEVSNYLLKNLPVDEKNRDLLEDRLERFTKLKVS